MAASDSNKEIDVALPIEESLFYPKVSLTDQTVQTIQRAVVNGLNGHQSDKGEPSKSMEMFDPIYLVVMVITLLIRDYGARALSAFKRDRSLNPNKD